MKTNYELYLRTWSHLNPNAKQDEDYETIDFEPCLNYKDAVKQAKRLSMQIPFKNSYGQEIVQVQIAAYYDGEEAEMEFGTSYYLLWRETYVRGKCLGRY